MHITTDRSVAFALFDALVERYTSNRFPFNKPDAILPQAQIPREIRRNKKNLALFYFYVCIYMRGGIESLQVFKALFRLWRDYPELYDPRHAEHLLPGYVETILRRYIGWDAERAGINWVENSRRLVWHWDGDPLNLYEGVTDYDEALRRIRNKTTKQDLEAAGPDGEGLIGHQPKMVSMQLYFADWEGWLSPRFPYPSPADFHNFRIGLNQGAIRVGMERAQLRTGEDISEPWREVVLAYLRERQADPIVVSDALWLFSLVMCGNSPVNAVPPENGSGLFTDEELPHLVDVETYRSSRMRRRLEETCLRCPVSERCTLAIPSRPYYRKGLLELRPRPRVEEAYGKIPPDTPIRYGEAGTPQNLDLFDPGG